MNTDNPCSNAANTPHSDQNTSKALKRRTFFKQAGFSAGAAAAALASPSLVSAQSAAVLAPLPVFNNKRIAEAFELRVAEATQDALRGAAVNIDNGDINLYPDKGGTYTKGLPHDAYGRVEPAAFDSFMTAVKGGTFADFENIPMGGTRTLTNPMGGLCFDLEVPDCVQFGQPQVPPAPAAASAQTAGELVEHYWAALLRDVPFDAYSSNELAAEAASEISSLPAYTGPRGSNGKVTPDLLFRGNFSGETVGPYLSQFLLQPAYFGSQPMTQQQWSYLPGYDYATDFASWLDLQNGVDTGQRNQMDPTLRYRRNGRDLASLTHMDVLFQEYFMAFLILANINATAPGSFTFGGARLNPGNPYLASRTMSGFGTFGGPDMASVIGDVAVKAVNAVWYLKWFVHLRARPEALGGIVHLLKTGQQKYTDVRLNNIILNSKALATSYSAHGSYLLPQAFPEGSPTHPSYPTGHGTVAGACITVLKFFYDGTFVLPNPVVASDDGLSLLPYNGPGLTVNGELNKLGHNVSFGHGIHSSIHYRSDTDTSLLFGEAVALAFLRNRARTYAEPFTVTLQKFDGTMATISNEGNL